MKTIGIFYTGGTIGMTPTKFGLAPNPNLPDKLKPLISDKANIIWKTSPCLIDSSSITPFIWEEWIENIKELFNQCDGVLMLTGTDTMAYTAALMNIVFANHNKALIITGSQKTFDEDKSDAKDNFLTALSLFEQGFNQCGIVFNKVLFDPADCRKFSTINIQGFSSVFRQPFAHYQNGNWYFFRQPEKPYSPKEFTKLNPNIKIYSAYLMPGASLEIVTEILSQNKCDAMILQSYGAGNIPDDKNFLNAVKNFCSQGKILLNISQTWQGNAEHRYAQNHGLIQNGAINGGKITPEQALAILITELSSPTFNYSYFQAA